MADLIPVPRDHTAVILVVLACGHVRIMNRKLFGHHFRGLVTGMDSFLRWPGGRPISLTCPVHCVPDNATDMIAWRS